jgi:ABC-2 type transport system ATP-binding protein
MPVISIQNLTRKFGDVTAVDKLTLAVEQGEIFGLVGPDGAGKTTAIRLMLGILSADSGTRSVTSSTGYVSQRFSLYTELTVAENLALFADLYSVPQQELAPRVSRLMQFSRLEPFRDRLARNLSGGMKQKLALSCALIHTPKLLFLDEPTTGVDPLSRRDLWRLLFDLWQEGVTIVVSTPYMDEAERCSRVAFLSHGKLLASGAPDELRAQFRGVIFEVLVDDRFHARDLLAALPYVQDVNVFGEGLHVAVAAGAAAGAESSLRALFEARQKTVRSIRRIDPSMEDVFFQLTKGAA